MKTRILFALLFVMLCACSKEDRTKYQESLKDKIVLTHLTTTPEGCKVYKMSDSNHWWTIVVCPEAYSGALTEH